MKIIAILGSPRGMTGNTGMLLEGLLEGVRAAGAVFETFSLDKYTVEPCRSCEGCHITGDCPVADDFDLIKNAIVQADGLVLASPNYIVSVSAQLKALLDRFSGPIHTQLFEGKYAAAVVTSGSGGFEEVEQYLLRAARMSGFQSVGSVGALGYQMMNPQTRQPLIDAAAAVGRKLVNAIRTKQQFSEQAEERRAIHERMKQLVTMQKEHWPYEFAWWNGRE